MNVAKKEYMINKESKECEGMNDILASTDCHGYGQVFSKPLTINSAGMITSKADKQTQVNRQMMR